MRVLIVKVSALGDVVHTLPVLDYLRQVSPGIEIDWVVEEGNRGILDGHPLLRKLHLVRTRAWRRAPCSFRTWREMSRVRKELREAHYDIVFDVQGNFKSGLITWLAGCERRYGLDRDDVREPLNLIFTNNQVPLRRQDAHVSYRALRVISAPFGKDYTGMQLSTDIFTSPEEDAEAEALLSTLADGIVFLFQPGTTWTTKLWSEKKWIELANRISSQYPDATVLINWGGDSEKRMAERIASSAKGAVRPLPRLTIRPLVALLKKVDIVVGPDSGPVHIAATVGTPTVSFYRATRGKWLGPIGPCHVKVQSPMHCTDCQRRTCINDEECIDSITTDMIWNGIKSIIA